MSSNKKNQDDKSENKFHLKRTEIKLDEGDCAVLVKETGEAMFIHNVPGEMMNDIQMAVAGALVAIVQPEWRLKLIDLLLNEQDNFTNAGNLDEIETIKVGSAGPSVDSSSADSSFDLDFFDIKTNKPKDFGPN
jgi:hypothetical protein